MLSLILITHGQSNQGIINEHVISMGFISPLKSQLIQCFSDLCKIYILHIVTKIYHESLAFAKLFTSTSNVRSRLVIPLHKGSTTHKNHHTRFLLTLSNSVKNDSHTITISYDLKTWTSTYPGSRLLIRGVQFNTEL